MISALDEKGEQVRDEQMRHADTACMGSQPAFSIGKLVTLFFLVSLLVVIFLLVVR